MEREMARGMSTLGRLSDIQHLSVDKASVCLDTHSKNHIELSKLQKTLEKAFQQKHSNSLESSVQANGNYLFKWNTQWVVFVQPNAFNFAAARLTESLFM